MAYSQIDPARLEGDALTNWYLRSPDDIEQERQAAAARRYDDFFAGGSAEWQTPDQPGQGADPGAGSDTRRLSVVASPDRSQAPSSDPKASAEVGPGGADQSTTYAPSITRVAAPAWLCSGCHGSGISPVPPLFSKPPWAVPWTPGPNLTPRKPAKPHPPQCAMQNMNDSRICSREPYDAWKSVCLESASEREAYCISHDGEVGWPPLETHDRR
jgi:hypothetical protein